MARPKTAISSQQRKIQTYPSPKYHALTIAYAKENDIKESKAVSCMIKAFFDSMPEHERLRYQKRASNHY